MVKEINKKEKIYEIAAKVFGERGYDGASLDEIALRSKVAKGTIFYYFKNKEELFLSLIERGLSRLTEEIVVIAKNADSKDKLGELIECHFVFFKKYRNVGMMILNQMGYLKNRWNKRLNEVKDFYVESVKGIIAVEKKRNNIAGDLEAEGIIVSIFSLLAMMGLDWSVFSLQISKEKMNRTIKEIIFRGVKGM